MVNTMKKIIIAILLVFGGCMHSFAQIDEKQMSDFFENSKYDLIVDNWNAYEMLSKIMHFGNEFKSGSVKVKGNDIYVTINSYGLITNSFILDQRHMHSTQRVKLRFDGKYFRKLEVLNDTDEVDTFATYEVARFVVDKTKDVATFYCPFLDVFNDDVNNLLKSPEKASLLFLTYMWDKYKGK